MRQFKNIYIFILFLLFSISCNPYSLPEEKTVDVEKLAYSHYLKSMELVESGEYEDALDEVNQAISLNSRFAQFYQLRGDIYRHQYEYNAALISYESAVAMRSKFVDVYKSMGEIYLKLQRYEDALKSFRKVRANDPLDVDNNLDIAECYMEMNELEVAYNDLADYRRMQMMAGQELNPRYYELLGITYFRFKRYKDAIKQLEMFRQYQRQNINMLFLLGKSYYQAGDFEKGLDCFNELIRIDDSVGMWYLYRGIYFYQNNNYVDAISQLKLANDLDPAIREVHLFLGRSYEAVGETEKALDELSIYRQGMPNTVGSEEDDLMEIFPEKNPN